MNISPSHHKVRVGAVVFDKSNKKLLLFWRHHRGQEYYCAIGGTVEKDEDLISAIKREVYEEVNLTIKSPQQIFEYDHELFPGQHEVFYLVSEFEGEIKLGFPELGNLSTENIFRPEWISLNKIFTLNLLPPILKEWLIANFDMLK